MHLAGFFIGGGVEQACSEWASLLSVEETSVGSMQIKNPEPTGLVSDFVHRAQGAMDLGAWHPGLVSHFSMTWFSWTKNPSRVAVKNRPLVAYLRDPVWHCDGGSGRSVR